MSTQSALPQSGSQPGSTTYAPGTSDTSNVRWFVCGLLFLATTINYMDRSVLSLIEPKLHELPFMGWSDANPKIFNDHFSTILVYFQIAYGIGLLTAGRMIDKLGTKLGYALAILIWGLSSMGHALVSSVAGFCIARFMLGIGESGNFPAAIKATTEWFPTEERALATGLFNSGANASSLIAPWLIPIVTIRYGWHAAFLTTGSMGMCWLVIWLLFPYNRLRRASSQTQANLDPVIPATARVGFFALFGELAKTKKLWAFSIAKGLTDPIWWFYLFWLPKYFNETYKLDLKHLGLPIIVVYTCSSVGSIAGGWLSGKRMKMGHSVNSGRKFAMLVCAICALPVMGVPWMHDLFGMNYWPAVALLSLAAAAHQGWSANLFSTPTDMFPSAAVSTVVGIGGASGALGGAIFTKFTGFVWISHPFLIFLLGALSYLISLLIFQLLVPRLGVSAKPPSPPAPSTENPALKPA
jgi:ACS family hexuronate transporter-like MFS transporter